MGGERRQDGWGAAPECLRVASGAAPGAERVGFSLPGEGEEEEERCD